MVLKLEIVSYKNFENSSFCIRVLEKTHEICGLFKKFENRILNRELRTEEPPQGATQLVSIKVDGKNFQPFVSWLIKKLEVIFVIKQIENSV